jgi:hypothetical protein
MSNRLHAQQPGFLMRLDFGGDDIPGMFLLDDNGNFVGIVNIAPPTDSFYVHQTTVYKISQFGDTTSLKIAKQDTSLQYHCITRTMSGIDGFILQGLGFRLGDSAQKKFTVFTRIDDEMNILWEKIYNLNEFYWGYRYFGMELQNEDFLYACSNNNKLHLLKLSPQGDSLAYKRTVSPEAGDLWGLTYNADSTKVLANTEWAYYNGGDSISSAIEIDEETLDITGHWFYPDYFRGPYRSMPYTDNRMLAGGSLQWYHYDEDKFDWLISGYILDSDNNIFRQVHRTNPDTISRAAEIYGVDYVDPSIIYLGGTHNLQDLIGQQPSWIYITRLNDTLGVVYEKYIGGDANYVAMNITASPDGGVLITATVHDIGITYFQRDAMIIKLDANGSITGTTENDGIPVSDAIVYPNPGGNQLFVRTALKDCQLLVFDVSGKLMMTKPIQGLVTSVSMEHLPAGHYPYIVQQQGNKIISGIWIKQE